MKKHIAGEQILKYAVGLVSSTDVKAVERHLEGCDMCLLKVTEAFNKLKRACLRAESLLEKYIDGKLDPKDTIFVRKHILICDLCKEKCRELIDDREKNEREILVEDIYRFAGQTSPDTAGAFGTSVPRAWKGLPLGRDYFELDQKGLSIGFTGGKQGEFMVHLKSEKYTVSGVKVSLGKTTKEGFNPMLSAVTTTKGVAKLGRFEDGTPKEKKSKFSLHITGLKKKDK